MAKKNKKPCFMTLYASTSRKRMEKRARAAILMARKTNFFTT